MKEESQKEDGSNHEEESTVGLVSSVLLMLWGTILLALLTCLVPIDVQQLMTAPSVSQLATAVAMAVSFFIVGIGLIGFFIALLQRYPFKD